jgi:hypothetical protein
MKEVIPEFKWLYIKGFEVAEAFRVELVPLIDVLSNAKSFEETFKACKPINVVVQKMNEKAYELGRESPALARIIDSFADSIINLMDVHKATWVRR